MTQADTLNDKAGALPAWTLWALGAVFVAFLALAYRAAFGGAGTVDEWAPGLKRWTGNWEAKSRSTSLGSAVGSPDVTLDVEVKMFMFTPAEIKVKRGQVVRLKLNAMDDGMLPAISGAGTSGFTGHGFTITGPYDIWVTGLRKDTTREVTFLASTPGEYVMECTVFCGPAHPSMRGKFIVE